MAAGKGVERLVDFNSGHFLQRVLPYISERDGITGALLVMQDQSRVFRTEHDLQEREAMLGALLENTAYGIVSIAEDGIVELFNPVAERLFGYRADEVIGQNVSLLMPEPERSEHDRYLGDYLAGGKPGMLGRSRNVEAQHKDGTVFPIVLTINEAWAGGRRFFVGLVAGTG